MTFLTSNKAQVSAICIFKILWSQNSALYSLKTIVRAYQDTHKNNLLHNSVYSAK